MNIEKIDGYMQRNAIIDTNTKPIIDCTDTGGTGGSRGEEQGHRWGRCKEEREAATHRSIVYCAQINSKISEIMQNDNKHRVNCETETERERQRE